MLFVRTVDTDIDTDIVLMDAWLLLGGSWVGRGVVSGWVVCVWRCAGVCARANVRARAREWMRECARVCACRGA